MRTKEFIKMLQEADPTGEGFIRLGDGIPYIAETKEGYWDGPYAYIDDDGNYVQSTKGYKIDVWGMNIGDFVEHHFEFDNPNNWEDIKSKIKSDTTYANKEQRDKKHEGLLTKAKKRFDQMVEIYTKIKKEKE